MNSITKKRISPYGFLVGVAVVQCCISLGLLFYLMTAGLYHSRIAESYERDIKKQENQRGQTNTGDALSVSRGPIRTIVRCQLIALFLVALSIVGVILGIDAKRDTRSVRLYREIAEPNTGDNSR